MATGTAWDGEALPSDQSGSTYRVNDAPNLTGQQGAGDTNGKQILNLCCAAVLGALGLLWLFGGVLMKDARL